MNRSRIKQYSDEIIKTCISKEPHNWKILMDIFQLFNPYIMVSADFIGMNTNSQTKIHYINNTGLGTLSFRIKKDVAKKINLYPYNLRSYKIVYKVMYDRSQFKSKYSDRMVLDPNTITKRTIHFSSTSHKDVKKFEFPKLLTWAYKIDKDIFLKIEKVLFEATG